MDVGSFSVGTPMALDIRPTPCVDMDPTVNPDDPRHSSAGHRAMRKERGTVLVQAYWGEWEEKEWRGDPEEAGAGSGGEWRGGQRDRWEPVGTMPASIGSVQEGPMRHAEHVTGGS